MAQISIALWIAFELYLWHIEHSLAFLWNYSTSVVNCFWIVSLTYWAQPPCFQPNSIFSCELLLNCIFDILSTAWLPSYILNISLWIAFELYLWHIEHSWKRISDNSNQVVNCFWIVSLTYWAQRALTESMLNKWLWIAFELYLWHIEHS